jgi:hypothetical protein
MKSAQSVLEYFLLLAVTTVIVVLAFSAQNKSGVYNQVSEKLKNYRDNQVNSAVSYDNVVAK